MLSKLSLVRLGVVGVVVCLLVYISRSIAEHGKVQVRLIVLGLPFLFLWIRNLTNPHKFRLLLVSILLIALQTRKLPFRLSLSEVILLGICLVELPILQIGRKHISNTKNKLSVLIPYCIFVAGGFISGIINGGITIAQQVCLVPLLWMYVAMVLVNTQEDAFKIIRMAVFGVLGCFSLLWVGNQTGFAITESVLRYRTIGESIAIGPFYYIYTPLRFGTMIALVIPAIVLLLIRSNTHGLRLLYLFIFALFVGLLLKATGRGASIGAFAGLLIICILTFRQHWFKIMVFSSLFVIGFVIFTALPLGTRLIGKFHLEKNISTYSELFVTGQRHYTLDDRINTLKFTIENTMENPFGNGFQYLFKSYGIDEAIIYSVLLNGTGIIGFISYMFMMGHLLLHFIRCFMKGVSENETDLPALGIATLVCALLAGVSSESVVWNEINPFILWAILAACYGGTCNRSRSPGHMKHSVNVPNPVRV